MELTRASVFWGGALLVGGQSFLADLLPSDLPPTAISHCCGLGPEAIASAGPACRHRLSVPPPQEHNTQARAHGWLRACCDWAAPSPACALRRPAAPALAPALAPAAPALGSASPATDSPASASQPPPPSRRPHCLLRRRRPMPAALPVGIDAAPVLILSLAEPNSRWCLDRP